MSKRKRHSDADDDNNDASAAIDFRRQRQVAATFADSAKQLARAFKAGKGFERQKLGRRKKNAVAAKDDKDVERIDAEVAALKVRVYARTVPNHTYGTVKSSKRLTRWACKIDTRQYTRRRALPRQVAVEDQGRCDFARFTTRPPKAKAITE